VVVGASGDRGGPLEVAVGWVVPRRRRGFTYRSGRSDWSDGGCGAPTLRLLLFVFVEEPVVDTQGAHFFNSKPLLDG